MRSSAIISPMQGDGKSTCAINIALALKEIEGPILLVDADMRRPSLHAKLRLPNDRGLSDVLVGQTPLSQAVQIDERSGLAVLTSGTPAPNPVKLLESRSFDALIEEALKSFEMVIFDAAALVGECRFGGARAENRRFVARRFARHYGHARSESHDEAPQTDGRKQCSWVCAQSSSSQARRLRGIRSLPHPD